MKPSTTMENLHTFFLFFYSLQISEKWSVAQKFLNLKQYFSRYPPPKCAFSKAREKRLQHPRGVHDVTMPEKRETGAALVEKSHRGSIDFLTDTIKWSFFFRFVKKSIFCYLTVIHFLLNYFNCVYFFQLNFKYCIFSPSLLFSFVLFYLLKSFF